MSALVHSHLRPSPLPAREGAHPSHITLLLPRPRTRQKHAAKQPCSGRRGGKRFPWHFYGWNKIEGTLGGPNGMGGLFGREGEVWLSLTSDSERPIMLRSEAYMCAVDGDGGPGMRCPLCHRWPHSFLFLIPGIPLVDVSLLLSDETTIDRALLPSSFGPNPLLTLCLPPALSPVKSPMVRDPNRS